MGACGSSMTAEEKLEAKKNRELEAANRKQHEVENSKLKLLLLGTGESGKSTLFKQMKILFSQQHGFTQNELQAGIKIVRHNIMSNLKTLLINCNNHTPAEDSALAEEIIKMDEAIIIDKKIAEKIKSIWDDKGVQKSWLVRSSFQVQDALEYFINNIERIAKDNYLPTNQDMLRTRVRTSGIVQAEYKIKDITVAMFDVGGQRNERKKWIHCFDNVTAIIFVAAISEYDQVLFEDQHTNRQLEALNLFKEICDSDWFQKKSMILFLNKRDVFRKKLTYIPFKVEVGADARNVDYNGPVAIPNHPSSQEGTKEFEAVYEAHCAYLEKLYKSQSVPNKSGPARAVYVYFTCSTDSDQVKVVMESCKDIMLKNNLHENGFM